MNVKKCGLVLALALFSSMAMANNEGASQDVSAIVADQHKLQEEMRSGSGRAEHLSQKQKQEVAKHQAVVFDVLAQAENVEQLQEARKIQAFNALESIKAILSSAEDDRQVCRRERPTGSNRVVTSCRTVREIREEQEAARRALQPSNRMPLDAAGG